MSLPPDDDPVVNLAKRLVEDQAAADLAYGIETARMRVIGLALNYASLQLVQQVSNRLPGDIDLDVPEDYFDTAHEPLDAACADLLRLLGR